MMLMDTSRLSLHIPKPSPDQWSKYPRPHSDILYRSGEMKLRSILRKKKPLLEHMISKVKQSQEDMDIGSLPKESYNQPIPEALQNIKIKGKELRNSVFLALNDIMTFHRYKLLCFRNWGSPSGNEISIELSESSFDSLYSLRQNISAMLDSATGYGVLFSCIRLIEELDKTGRFSSDISRISSEIRGKPAFLLPLYKVILESETYQRGTISRMYWEIKQETIAHFGIGKAVINHPTPVFRDEPTYSTRKFAALKLKSRYKLIGLSAAAAAGYLMFH
jgi:hypothetical protein